MRSAGTVGRLQLKLCRVKFVVYLHCEADHKVDTALHTDQAPEVRLYMLECPLKCLLMEDGAKRSINPRGEWVLKTLYGYMATFQFQ